MPHQRKYSMGSEGYCVCPKCETRVVHQPGVPCIDMRCPKCGAKMLRENSDHHKALLEKKQKSE